MKIVSMLRKNGRLAFTEIARRLKISESTARKRVDNLEKTGVIKGYSAIIDPEKIGFKNVAIVGIDVEPDKFLDIARRLAEFDEAKYVATSTGDHMILVELWAKDGKELTFIISEKIGKIEGVKKICPAIILEKLKE